MNRFAACCWAAVFALTAVAADAPPPKPADAPATAATKGKLLPHFKALGLSDAQKTQVETITAAASAKIHDLEAQITAIREKEHTDALAVLTDEQRKHLAELLTGATDKTK